MLQLRILDRSFSNRTAWQDFHFFRINRFKKCSKLDVKITTKQNNKRSLCYFSCSNLHDTLTFSLMKLLVFAGTREMQVCLRTIQV